MKKIIKQYFEEIIKEYKSKSYIYWDTIELPIVIQKDIEGKGVQFEIDLLKTTPEYREIDVTVDSGGLSAYFPYGKSFKIMKRQI